MMTTTELAAGRELDALVAVEVMGWRWWRTWRDERFLAGPDYVHADDLYHAEPTTDLTLPEEESRWWLDEARSFSDLAVVPHFTTDITAAWLVVEKLELKGWNGTLVRTWDGYRAEFDNGNTKHAASVDPRDGGMPLAICRAALAALTPTEGSADE